MFDNNQQQNNPPSNLPGADLGDLQAPLSSQPSKDVAPNNFKEASQSPSTFKPPASSVNPHGQVEDIFANTEKSAKDSGYAGFKVKTVDNGENIIPPSGIRPSLHNQTPPSLSSQQVSVPPIPEPPSSRKSPPKINNDLEFEVHDSSKKRYFILGIIGLLVLVGGGIAYFFFFNTGFSLPFINMTEPETSIETNSNANPTSVPNTQNPTTSPPPVVPPAGNNPPNGETQPITTPVAEPDTDSDGLTDAEERAIGTSITNQDTDSDGLFDREEVRVYVTDPLDQDTDGDGYLDGEEVNGGFDPKGPGRLLPSLP